MPASSQTVPWVIVVGTMGTRTINHWVIVSHCIPCTIDSVIVCVCVFTCMPVPSFCDLSTPQPHFVVQLMCLILAITMCCAVCNRPYGYDGVDYTIAS